jgi:mannose-1-phosphate guanylyltransferase
VAQILREIHSYLPGCTRFLQQMDAGMALSEAWPQCEATSIDYGVMERSKDVVVVPGNFGWSDVGSWPALAEVLPAAPYGWSVAEAVIAEAASGNVVHAPNKVVALVGVQDLIVVDTPDALLVAQMDHAQAIRNVIARLEQEGLERLT